MLVESSHSRKGFILGWFAGVAVYAIALLLFPPPAPAREEPSRPAVPVTGGIDIDYLPARFHEEQKRAAIEEPAPSF